MVTFSFSFFFFLSQYLPVLILGPFTLNLYPTCQQIFFFLAFHIFCNIHSILHCFHSDNTKTFLKGGNVLENSLILKEVQAELENKINHKDVRVPLYSAWIPSVWERLIKVL